MDLSFVYTITVRTVLLRNGIYDVKFDIHISHSKHLNNPYESECNFVTAEK